MGFGRAREPPACRAASLGLVWGFSSRMATSRVAPVLQAHVAEALAPHAAVGHWLGNLWVTPCLKAKLRCAKQGARWLLLFYTWGQAGNCCSDPVPGSAPRRPEGGFRSLGPPPGWHRRLGRAGSTSLPLQPVTGCEAAAGSWEPGNRPPVSSMRTFGSQPRRAGGPLGRAGPGDCAHGTWLRRSPGVPGNPSRPEGCPRWGSEGCGAQGIKPLGTRTWAPLGGGLLARVGHGGSSGPGWVRRGGGTRGRGRVGDGPSGATRTRAKKDAAKGLRARRRCRSDREAELIAGFKCKIWGRERGGKKVV